MADNRTPVAFVTGARRGIGQDTNLVPMKRWADAPEIGRAVASLATGAIPFSTGG